MSLELSIMVVQKMAVLGKWGIDIKFCFSNPEKEHPCVF